jgi:minor extracellular serine protease Vpr
MSHARTLRILLRTLLLVALLASFAIQNPTPALAGPTPLGITVQNVTPHMDLSDAIRTSDGKVRVIVELAQAPLVTYGGALPGLAPTSPTRVGGKLDVSSAASQAYTNFLKSNQDSFVSAAVQVAPSAVEVTRFQVGINAVSLAVSETEAANLYKIPGVLHVYPDRLNKATMDASLPLINAPAMWTLLGGQSKAGAGIKVADVDTGLRPANPMFAGTGFTMPAGYPKGYCATNPSDPNFQCNGKLIAARAIPPDGSFPVVPGEFNTPLDYDGHGSHTAGTATGNPVTVMPWNLQISGVAPGAYLMVYKGLYETVGGGASGSDSMLVSALELAVGDGADVINNSWGGSAGGDPKNTVFTDLIHNITQAGTLVVFSAGNDGPFSGSIGCPGCAPDAITVGASTTDRTFIAQVSVDSATTGATIPDALKNIQGRSVLAASVTRPVVDLAVAGYADPIACGTLTPQLTTLATDKIVVIERGTCALVDKVALAKAAGAVGVIIRNVAGGSTTLPIIQPVLPTAHIAQADGDALAAFLTANASGAVTMTLHGPATRVLTDQPDVVASFSSIGPNGDPNFLKPDIVAPGVNILSALSPVPSGGADPFFGFEQGTSMAAPHVTGSAALLKALHPDWTANQIKSALVTTATRTNIFAPDGKTAADEFTAGAGRLDLGRASNVGVVFDLSSFTSGNCVVTCVWKNTIKNVTADTVTWTASFSGNPKLHLTVTPASVTLPPGLSASFTVTATGLDVSTTDWNQDSITWTPNVAKYTPAFMPVVIIGGTVTDAGTFDMVASQATTSLGQTIDFSALIQDPFPAPTTFYFSNPIPAGTTYVEGSATPAGLTYDPAKNSLIGSFQLPALNLGLAAASTPVPFVELVGSAGALDLSSFCTAFCVDEMLDLNAPINYLGRFYTRIGVSTNGYLMIGGSTTSIGTNQMLPDPALPNNVIAPFWTALRYVTGTPTPTTPLTGSLLVGQDALSGEYIFEWSDVTTPTGGGPFTFEAFVNPTTGQVRFAYKTLPGSLSGIPVTVGIENSAGTLGANYYYAPASGSPAGTAPVVGTDVLSSAPPNQLLTFSLKVTGPISQFKVTNVATLTNSTNSETQQAALTVPFLTLPRYLPLINR